MERRQWNAFARGQTSKVIQLVSLPEIQQPKYALEYA